MACLGLSCLSLLVLTGFQLRRINHSIARHTLCLRQHQQHEHLIFFVLAVSHTSFSAGSHTLGRGSQRNFRSVLRTLVNNSKPNCSSMSTKSSRTKILLFTSAIRSSPLPTQPPQFALASQPALLSRVCVCESEFVGV